MRILQPGNRIHISLNGLYLFQINNISKRNNTRTHTHIHSDTYFTFCCRRRASFIMHYLLKYIKWTLNAEAI
jgi:hypothetical protein